MSGLAAGDWSIGPEGIVLGTRNAGKLRELAALLEPLGIQARSLDDVANSVEVEETGDSFAANAALKAVGQARVVGLPVLGEDSGLAVDALGGAPGIYSARFSGPHATDSANNALLLERLFATSVDPAEWTAHYVCHMVLASPDGQILGESRGECHGRIVAKPRGEGGFGYDPLFMVLEYHRTFGQLSPLVKGLLSHRGRAVRRMAELLRRHR